MLENEPIIVWTNYQIDKIVRIITDWYNSTTQNILEFEHIIV